MDNGWGRVGAALTAVAALVLGLLLIGASLLVASGSVVWGLMIFVAGGLCWAVALLIVARHSL